MRLRNTQVAVIFLKTCRLSCFSLRTPQLLISGSCQRLDETRLCRRQTLRLELHSVDVPSTSIPSRGDGQWLSQAPPGSAAAPPVRPRIRTAPSLLVGRDVHVQTSCQLTANDLFPSLSNYRLENRILELTQSTGYGCAIQSSRDIQRQLRRSEATHASRVGSQATMAWVNCGGMILCNVGPRRWGSAADGAVVVSGPPRW